MTRRSSQGWSSEELANHYFWPTQDSQWLEGNSNQLNKTSILNFRIKVENKSFSWKFFHFYFHLDDLHKNKVIMRMDFFGRSFVVYCSWDEEKILVGFKFLKIRCSEQFKCDGDAWYFWVHSQLTIFLLKIQNWSFLFDGKKKYQTPPFPAIHDFPNLPIFWFEYKWRNCCPTRHFQSLL